MRKTSIFLLSLVILFTMSCKQKTENLCDNPLLQEWDTPYGVPPFDKIKIEDYKPAFLAAMQEQKDNIQTIIDNPEEANFENTIAALEFSGLTLSKVIGVFFNLLSSDTNEELQKIAQEISPLLSNHSDEISMSPELFARIEKVYNNRENENLNKEQLRVVELTYKNFVKGGAKLNDEDKKRLMEINERTSLLSLQFGDNLLAETNGYKLIIDNEDDLAGLPEGLIEAASIVAEENGENGKWMFTLHNASVLPFLQYSDNRELRKEIQQAYINRCNNDNEYDNKEIILELVELRIERAKLLGYENHSQYILEDNMAKTPEAVYELLNQVWAPALEVAKHEAELYREMMKKEGIQDDLQAWDWRYYTEKVRKEKYDLDEGELKPYFKLENVRDGVFEVSNKLFGLNFIKSDNIPIYHPDVEAYEVKDDEGEMVAVLYMDYFPRPSKSGGAWMNDYRGQYIYEGKNVIPIITINCNFTKPTSTTPSLLTFDEAETLFHEFGHGLHGMLSKCTYPSVSGTNVPRDFVELPSQLMEHWASEPEVLKSYARHYQTNEPISDELIQKMEDASHFNQGFATTEFIAAALLDMYYHTLSEMNITDVLLAEKQALDKIGLIPEIVVRYRSSYFSHIFGGGYSSGYYSYIWSEVLDSDVFGLFKEKGIFDPETAKSLKDNIYSNGHKDEPMTMFVNFRGREPKIDALLEGRGLK
ncbi:MAG: M3 family metallopeptidase [Bacteroidales bacterium]|jgi:peptidyl-dipeptidase Dcp|nr:M3 family metallopeptidase [Bacteroidales bacterium]